MSYKEKLNNLERMSIISYMSNLFAHEIRQPITNIILYSTTLLDVINSGNLNSDSIYDLSSRIKDQAKRSNEIVGRLGSYAKNRDVKNLSSNVHDVIQTVIRDLSQDIGDVVQTELSDQIMVCIDPFEFEFVVRTLVRNAMDALKGIDDPHIRISTFRRQGGMVEISVSDNGENITEDIFNNLGKYLISKKDNGLGFGLAVASEIVEKYNGHLEFRRVIPAGLNVAIVLREAMRE